jgi:hypothetical protein
LGVPSLLKVIFLHPRVNFLLRFHALHSLGLPIGIGHGLGVDQGWYGRLILDVLALSSLLSNLDFLYEIHTLHQSGIGIGIGIGIGLRIGHGFNGLPPDRFPVDASYPLGVLTIEQDHGLCTALQPKVLFEVRHLPHQQGDPVPQFL